jgi:hypothetical protein
MKRENYEAFAYAISFYAGAEGNIISDVPKKYMKGKNEREGYRVGENEVKEP